MGTSDIVKEEFDEFVSSVRKLSAESEMHIDLMILCPVLDLNLSTVKGYLCHMGRQLLREVFLSTEKY